MTGRRAVSKAPNGLTNDERFDRLWALEPNSGCYLWLAVVTIHGHGHFGVRQGNGQYLTVIASRYAYIREYGAVPEGRIVCHKCNVPGCVNPAHLYAGTHASNCNDARAAGTHISVRPDLMMGEANGNAKLSQADADDIKARYRSGRPYHKGNGQALATEYGVTEHTIRDVAKRKRFANVQ